MPKVQPKHTADSLLDTKNIFTPQYHVSQYSISGTIGVQPTGQAQDIVSPINEPMGVLVYNDQHITDDSSLSVTLLYLLVSSNLSSFNFSGSFYSFPSPLPLHLPPPLPLLQLDSTYTSFNVLYPLVQAFQTTH